MAARFAILLLVIMLAGCAVPRDGRDDMDGGGVAAGLRYELQNNQ